MSDPALERRILALAEALSADPGEARDWYRSEPIARLGRATASELVAAGQGARVLGFLLDVLAQERRTPPAACGPGRAPAHGAPGSPRILEPRRQST